jgi:hypothetical protein
LATRRLRDVAAARHRSCSGQIEKSALFPVFVFLGAIMLASALAYVVLD